MQFIRRHYLEQARPNAPRGVFITGGTSGIGRATALLFAALGDDVAITGRRADRLDAVVSEAETDDLPGRVLPIVCDVTDGAAMQRAAAAALAGLGRLDIVVANAGVGHRGALADAAWADIETTLRTNIDGVIHTVRATLPGLRASRTAESAPGHIVLISSVAGPVPSAYASIYGASKAAVDALGRALRTELHPERIRVSVLWVGQTHTGFSAARLGQPGRVASKWPTMTPEQVAGGVLRALDRNPRAMTLRTLDGLLVRAGRWFPGIVDRILARIYG